MESPHLILDGSHSSRPILVTGAHRTGTTWVGKMLAAGGEAAYISEPLNTLHRPGVMLAPTRYWYTYICSENEEQYLPALLQTLRFRYHPVAELLSLRSRKDVLRMARDSAIFLQGKLRHQRPLLKDPFAVFSAPWFAQRLNCRVVITVRHPAAFASSLKRLRWQFDFSDLLEQPLLMRDLLGPFKEEMLAMQQTPEDVIGQGALLWRLVYTAVSRFQQEHPDFMVVRHEDLSLDPEAGYRALYQSLGLDYNSKAQASIRTASSEDNPRELSKNKVFAVRLDSRANLHNWRRRLAPEEIARIRDLTGGLVERFYPDLEWEQR